MKYSRLFSSLCLTVMVLQLWLVPAQAMSYWAKRDINRLIDKVDPNLNVGIKIVDVKNGRVIYQRNADRTFVPASNLKLYTDAAALLYLGPGFQFQTQLFTNAKRVQNHVLRGNLYVKFGGDPTLTSAELAQLIAQLKHYQVRSIRGNVVVDTSNFAAKPYGPGWMSHDEHYGYGAQNTPLSLDQNAQALMINPATRSGVRAHINLIPPNRFIRVRNHLKTVSMVRNCRVHYKMNAHNTLTVSGCIYISGRGFWQRIAIVNPWYYAHQVIKHALRQQHIVLHGNIVRGTTKQHSKLLASYQSPNLSQIVLQTLKPSNNVLADAVFLKLGQAYYHHPATWANGALAVQTILNNKIGINFDSSTIADGSGLSRYNLVTPANTVKLLRYMYNDFPVAYEFIAALPVAGRDGTLVKHMLAEHMQGWARAKTGSMTGISSLSGYFLTKRQHVYAFSIMVNGFSGPIKKYRDLEDRIIGYFVCPDCDFAAQPSAYSNSLQNRWRKTARIMNREEIDLRAVLRNSGVAVLRFDNAIRLKVPRLRLSSKLMEDIAHVVDHFPYGLIKVTGYGKDHYVALRRAQWAANKLQFYGLSVRHILVADVATKPRGFRGINLLFYPSHHAVTLYPTNKF